MSTDDSSQTLIYVASFVGMLGFLGVFGEVLRRKHRKEVQQRNILLEAVLQRQQHVVGKYPLPHSSAPFLVSFIQLRNHPLPFPLRVK